VQKIVTAGFSTNVTICMVESGACFAVPKAIAAAGHNARKSQMILGGPSFVTLFLCCSISAFYRAAAAQQPEALINASCISKMPAAKGIAINARHPPSLDIADTINHAARLEQRNPMIIQKVG
jgi:hypothetical protein